MWSADARLLRAILIAIAVVVTSWVLVIAPVRRLPAGVAKGSRRVPAWLRVEAWPVTLK